MNFIDRDAELTQLEREFARAGAALVILYGRRRLGKTSLLRQFAKGKPHCYFMADRAGETDLRRAVAAAMAHALAEPTLAAAEHATWYDLFAAFDRLRPAASRFMLIFDEYQYLCQVQPAFSSFVQKWWDEHWSQANLCVVLCGSATSMMYKETLASSAPLFGRATSQLLLRPIPLGHSRAFLPGKTWSQLIEFAALTGGVPRYLELAAPHSSLKQAIIELVLQPNGILHNEARQLLQEEIQSPNTCWSILHAIGSGATRISEIAARLREPANKLTRYLDLLRDLCLIARETPVLEARPQQSKKGVYVVADPFCRLWFGAIYPYSSLFEFGDPAAAYSRIEPLVATHVAVCFETLCREWLRTRAGQFQAARVGRQWSRQYDLDVAAVNAAGELTAIGECKWSTRQVGWSVLQELEDKAKHNDLPLAAGCARLLFSKSGFTQDLLARAAADRSIVLVSPGNHGEAFP